jgi:hypothetical protein
MNKRSILTIGMVIILSLLLSSPGYTATTSGTWTQIFPARTPPPARADSGFVYDQAHDNIIFFSGDDVTRFPYEQDVWVLANATKSPGHPSWKRLRVPGPKPVGRSSFSAVYDAVNNRMIIHAGCSGNCSPVLSDTWVLTNANGTDGTPMWIQLPSAPIGRSGHSAGYDPESNRMVIFAGNNGFSGGEKNDVWILTDANGIGNPSWMQLSPAGTPPSPRINPNSVYDPSSNSLIVYGGYNAGTITQYNDVWVLSNANGLGGTPTWTRLSPTGTLPEARWLSALSYDPLTRRLIMFGGLDEPAQFTPLDDTWVLTNANGQGGTPEWIQLSPGGTLPAARFWPLYAYSISTNRLIVVMGRGDPGGSTFLTDAWMLSDASGMTTP